ncbi:hypothetical protein B0H14DRAFT_2830873 [Mycena olivaceomarginata]|nr:hypothetical protein B0H14DRAFT_2830873 [Mycena olivaceomarginata]
MAESPTSLPAGNLSNSAPNLRRDGKAKAPKDKARMKLMLEFYETKSDNPTRKQYAELLAQIRNLPGEGNKLYLESSLRGWFDKRRTKRAIQEVATPAPVNPRYPSLTPALLERLEVSFNSVDPKSRVQPDSDAFAFYPSSASFEGGDEADIRIWIEDRILLESTKAQSVSQSAPGRKQRLHIDTNTNAPGQTNAEYSASSTGLPTPIGTMSPDARAYPSPLPRSASAAASALSALSIASDSPASGVQRRSTSVSASAHYHPYNASTYRPPTPASSRSPSLLKSELASLPNSPLTSTRVSLPPVASYCRSASASISATSSPLVPTCTSLPPVSVSASYHATFPPPLTPASLYSSAPASISAPTSSTTDSEMTAPLFVSIQPQPSLPPPPELDYSTRLLLAPMQGANVPTNYKEFEELFAEYEAPIFHVLANLQRNIQDAPPTQTTPGPG